MTPRELDVLGVRVDMVDERAALARIEQLHDEVPPRFVSYVNPHTINLVCRDPAFRPILDGAGLRLPDGFGIRIAARRQHVRVPAILNGSDFNDAVMRRAAERGWRVFLLGGRPGVAELAARRLCRRIPGLRLAGTHHGYFDEADSAAIAEQIRGSRASVVMVALGQPRQEQWLERHLAATGAGVGLAVGGFFDFAAGTVRRSAGVDEPRRPGMDVPPRPGAAPAGGPVPRRHSAVPVAAALRDAAAARPGARRRHRPLATSR